MFCAGGGNSTNGTGGGGNLTLSINTTSLAHSGDWVTVTWRNVHNPTSSDWIGVYLPTVRGTIDARNHAPIKFQVRYRTMSSFRCFSWGEWRDGTLVAWSYIAELEIAILEHVYFPNQARSVLEWHLFLPCSMLTLPQPTWVMEAGRWSSGWLTWEQVSSLDSSDLVSCLVVRGVEMDWWCNVDVLLIFCMLILGKMIFGR